MAYKRDGRIYTDKGQPTYPAPAPSNLEEPKFCAEIGCTRKVLPPYIYCDKHQDKNSTPNPAPPNDKLACEVENCPHHTQEPPPKGRHLKTIIPNLEVELDEILLKHRSDTLIIYYGQSNGLDVGTSEEQAKSQLKQLILKDFLYVIDNTKILGSGLPHPQTEIYQHDLRQSARKRYQ